MTQQQKPNIVIFVMDTQPIRNLTPYGYEKPTTPNLARIADEGLVYENHFVTGCWTMPVHASLFTGKYQSGHGAGVQHEFMATTFPTMAEILTGAGYQTVGFSSNTWVGQDETNIARGFETFTSVKRPGLADRLADQNPPNTDKNDLDSQLDSGSAETIRLTEKWFKEAFDSSRPFFLFINCVEPHLTAWACQPFRSAFMLPGVTEAETRAVNQDMFTERLGMVPDRPGGYMSAQDWAILKGLYDGETACLDHRIGLLYDHLQSLNLLDDTLLIIVSDHGDLLDRRGMMGHHLSLYDELIHTPLIVRWPSMVPQGKRFAGFVQICDWLPTFLDLLDINDEAIRSEIQGLSLLPTWRGETIRAFVIAEYMKALQVVERALRVAPDFDYRPWLQRQKIMRTHDLKYHWFSDGRDMLFNIQADPDERTNLVERMPDVAADMRQQLETFLRPLQRHDFGDAVRNHGFRGVRWDNIDRLRTWGLYRDVEEGD